MIAKSGAEYQETSEALETVSVGVALLISQTIIAQNEFFGEAEIKRFLALRRQFHPTFTEACQTLADEFESGVFGEGVKVAIPPLRNISRLPVAQSRLALAQLVRALRGLKHVHWSDTSTGVFRLIRQCVRVAADDVVSDPYDRENNYSFFNAAIRTPGMPTQLKTILRKAMQIGSRGKSLYVNGHEDENPGAWFDLTAAEKTSIREMLDESKAAFGRDYTGVPEAEREAILQTARDNHQRALRAAGVHERIVRSGAEPEEPLESVLRRESKLQIDGVTEYLFSKILRQVEESARANPKDRSKTLDHIPQDMRKVLTMLRKAKTFDTFKRILREATDRKLIGDDYLGMVDRGLEDAQKNRAVQEGIPLATLTWEPMSVEEFQTAHDTGDVVFPSDVPEEERKNILGRVSRAITDLETIFGKGFCGKHAKKLNFSFEGAVDSFARASYGTYPTPNRWQPQVTFGKDYDGVLAHELGHYFDDLLGHKAALRFDTEYVKNYEAKYHSQYIGSSIFGNTGVTIENFLKYTGRGEHLPEVTELMGVVLTLPDYARWKDMLSGAYEESIYGTVLKLTGSSPYALPDDHPYAKALDARYKSQLPPELVEAIEKDYKAAHGGDDRRLGYYQSVVEVWARLCEQYTYTKLAKRGIANPWLTQLHYDADIYVNQRTFELQIEPIMDRLFAKLSTTNLIARQIVSRFLRQMS